jgi:hypothetical protein
MGRRLGSGMIAGMITLSAGITAALLYFHVAVSAVAAAGDAPVSVMIVGDFHMSNSEMNG